MTLIPPAKQLPFGKDLRIRVLQISGLSLITLGILNTLFLSSQTSWLANFLVLAIGLGEWVLSLRLWAYYKRNSATSRLMRFSPASAARLTSHRLTSSAVPARF